MLRGSSLKYSIINGRRKWNDVRYSWGEPPEKPVNHIIISWVINTAFGAPRRGAINDDAASLKWIIFHQLCVFLLCDCSCGKTCAEVSFPSLLRKKKCVMDLLHDLQCMEISMEMQNCYTKLSTCILYCAKGTTQGCTLLHTHTHTHMRTSLLKNRLYFLGFLPCLSPCSLATAA